jgi:hypothetical protein
MSLWFIPAAVIAVLLVWTLSAFRGASNWPTADGTVTRLDVQRKQEADGHYSCAIFTYEFQDLDGRRVSSTWYKNFSSEQDARDFAARELPLGKQVLVRFNPKDPAISGTRFIDLHKRPSHFARSLKTASQENLYLSEFQYPACFRVCAHPLGTLGV